MIADRIVERAFSEKDKNGNTLFIPGFFSQRKIIITPEEEKNDPTPI